MGFSSLTDRMFKVASDKIELIEHEEFKSLYQREAPYITEWLLAKCGTSGVESFLSSDELEDYRLLRKAIDKEILRLEKKGETDYFDYILSFVPKSLSEDRVKYLRKKISDHNRPMYGCREKAIVRHQMKWAFENQ